MKAVEVAEPTPDYSGLRLVERDRPSPAPDEALVRIHACSLKHHDLNLVNSEMPFGPDLSFPVVPLSDGAGEVVEVGEDVERLSAGDRVATMYAPNWIEGEGSHEKFVASGIWDGVLAEYVAVPAESLAVLPEHLSFAEGATLPTAGVTAWHALVENGGLSADEDVLVLGTGGVSTFGLQFARMHGARTVVLSSSDEKLDRAEELGAWGTVNYEATPEWGDVVADMTDGGVDHVLEVNGASTLQRSGDAAAVNGHIHFVSTSAVLRETGPVFRPMLHKAVTVEWIWGAGSRAMFDRMNDAIGATGMTPVIDSTYGLEDVEDAYRRQDAGDHQGKLVVEVA